MNLHQLIQSKRADILRLAERHGATNVRIFGSVATGQTHTNSDLDLLVDVGPKRSFFFPGGLVVDLEKLLGIHVDVITPKGLKPRIREDVLEQARAL